MDRRSLHGFFGYRANGQRHPDFLVRLTPIFITPSSFPPWARFLLVANPLYYWFAVPDDSAGSAMPDLEDLAIAMLTARSVRRRWTLFRHMKRGFADVLYHRHDAVGRARRHRLRFA